MHSPMARTWWYPHTTSEVKKEGKSSATTEEEEKGAFNARNKNRNREGSDRVTIKVNRPTDSLTN